MSEVACVDFVQSGLFLDHEFGEGDSEESQWLLLLNKKQAELDHRESVLNSREASLESQIRIETVTIQQLKESLLRRQQKLDEQESQLKIREKELEQNESLLQNYARRIQQEIKNCKIQFTEINC